MSLITWSWIFLFGYMSLMVGIGIYAQRQIKHADDFATARGAYGPGVWLWRLRRRQPVGQPFLAAQPCHTSGDSQPCGCISFIPSAFTLAS